MFDSSEEEEKKNERQRKLEYGQILRSQMGSAKNRRPQQRDQDFAPIEEVLGRDNRSKMPKINKDEYRMELERQIQERKMKEDAIKRKMEEEDLKYQQNVLQNIQQPGMVPDRVSSSYSNNRPVSGFEANQQYVRQKSITSPNEETPEEIAKKLQYQSDLRAQIEEKERRKKEQEMEEKKFEVIEEQKKLNEQHQLLTQY